MTIGDEKVVERFSLEGYGGWLGLDADGDFVSHDAYAELAAELESERAASANLHTNLIAACVQRNEAESQLAELRGSLTEIATEIGMYDGVSPRKWQIRDWADQLRTLAAADGGGSGG